MTAYIVAYSLILFFIAAAVVALGLIWVRAQRTKLDRRAAQIDAHKNGEGLFSDIIGATSHSAFIIVEADTHSPVYISPNSNMFFDIDSEKLFLDLTEIAGAVGKKAWREFEQKYTAWDGSGVLIFEFGYGDGANAIAQASRTEREGKSYDVFLIYDITEQAAEMNKMREELTAARGEAAGKLSFLSSMSHEIRTPMNGVMGMMELARMNINNPAKAGEYLARAGDLSVFLLGMINDILDISKIESGKMQLFNTNLDVFAFAEKIKNMFNGMVTGKGINFNVETVDFSVRYLVGDEMRLTQVVTNLVSNASKFTPAGGKIDVTFKQLDHMGENIQLMIRVRDTGKGIAPENIRKIMKPFEQEEASTAHHYGGTGLGLAICDQIVQLMGGNIVVDSELGKGSDFSIFLSLPIADVDQIIDPRATGVKEQKAEIDFTFEGCKILLAEDNEVNAEIAVEILESEGAIVTLAHDGREAVEIFTGASEGSFDLLLLDIQMPRLNGRDAAREIRAAGKPDSKSVPIIALSADAFVEDVRLSEAAGMDGHVSKPIDFDELRKRSGEIIAAKKSSAG